LHGDVTCGRVHPTDWPLSAERIAARPYAEQDINGSECSGASVMAGYGYPVTGGGPGRLRASDADRDRVAAILGAAYSEGRLSQDEYDERLHGALSARTYADLDRLVSDLPTPHTAVVPPVPGTNGLAIASLACGIAQFVVGPLGTVPAIVLGHLARGQIRRSGEQGAGMAVAGLMLGWAAVILAIIVVAVALVAFRSSGPAPGYVLIGHR
jgi:hypothetical protein